MNGLNLNLYSGGLHSAYARGEAFVAGHQYAEATTEFQKILDHRGIVGADPIGALAHLQLGRTFALAGDTVKAKLAYGDFLTLWKDADSDVPILVRAKAEYAQLGGAAPPAPAAAARDDSTDIRGRGLSHRGDARRITR